MRSSLILVLLPALTSAASTFRFAHSYGSHMVLHQAPKSPIVWGFCASAHQCGSVNVTLAADGAPAAEAVTVAAQPGQATGTWIAKLPPTDGSDTPHTVTATFDLGTVILSDVLFGDVWVCSGQVRLTSERKTCVCCCARVCVCVCVCACAQVESS